MDQLPRLVKRELICLLLFTCNYVVSVSRGFLFLWVLRMGYVILLWHSLRLPFFFSNMAEIYRRLENQAHCSNKHNQYNTTQYALFLSVHMHGIINTYRHFSKDIKMAYIVIVSTIVIMWISYANTKM